MKSQILLLDPLPTLNKIFSMIIQHERQISPISTYVDDESKVLIDATDNRKPPFKKYGKKICTFCGKSGYTIDTCYHKHGGHPHLQCNSSTNAHNVSANNPDYSSFETPRDPNHQSSPQLTAEQYQTLMSILKTSNASNYTRASNQARTFHSPANTSNISISLCLDNSTVSSLIIASGASDHICGSIHWFQSFQDINPVNIILPNGNFTIAKQIGTINFTHRFPIHNVQYVPQFSLNLISVSKLCLDLPCIVKFTKSQCLIQDPQSLKMIGSADFIEGLYHLNLSNKKLPIVVGISSSNTITIPDQALWHFRLGHLSSSRMDMLHFIFPSLL